MLGDPRRTTRGKLEKSQETARDAVIVAGIYT